MFVLKQENECMGEFEIDIIHTFIQYAIDFMKIYTNITIEICDLDDSLRGFVEDFDDKFLVNVKQNMGLDQTAKTIAHELVHIKQHLNDPMLYKEIETTNVEYSKRWWEIEANEISETIFNSFIERMKEGQ